MQHSSGCSSESFLQTVNEITFEDISMFEASVFCAAIKSSKIVGSVKVTRWNKNIVLPIQKLFNINPALFTNNGVENIWHVGRFAISKSEKEGAKLLRKLLTLAIYPICNQPNSIMLAECDSKFVRALNLLGIKTETIAPGINYLGSETLPIYATKEWLSAFLNKSIYYQDAVTFHENKLKRNFFYGDEPSFNKEFLCIVPND